MPSDNAAIHVICLGAGGGPNEDDVTGFLVRSVSAKWSKNSILAVDAGCHLSAIQRILEHDFPIVANDRHARAPTRPNFQRMTTDDGQSSDVDSVTSSSPYTPQERQPTILESGPFAGLSFPHLSARANAVHVVREHVSTYLITHPHLDHFSGFAINTAAFHNTSRPKRLAALPFTVNAIKTHIFNDIVWPNLTDEEGGVGFVTFQRLTEGGNLALGEGSSRGFIEVCDGLAVKGFKVSHGRCAGAPQAVPSRRGSAAANTMDVPAPTHQHNHAEPLSGLTYLQQNGGSRTPKPDNRRTSVYSQRSEPGTPNLQSQEHTSCVVDSSAFFIRADETGREILMFGDVEPDSISALPRNHIVWAEAASRIVHGTLAGVFIECSYNDTQRDVVLFGHLAPRHLIKELETLAELVLDKRRDNAEKVGRKRKRQQSTVLSNLQETPESPVSPSFRAQDDTSKSSRLRTNNPTSTPTSKHASFADIPMLSASQVTETPGLAPQPALTMDDGNITTDVPRPQYEGPLKGLTVVVIHVKDTMTDGPLVGETILQDLWGHEARLASQGKALGCKFEVASSGQSYWL